jgi:hypothetical protein
MINYLNRRMDLIKDQLKILYTYMKSNDIDMTQNIYNNMILLLCDAISFELNYNNCWWTNSGAIFEGNYVVDAYHLTIAELDGTIIEARLHRNDLITSGSYIEFISVIKSHKDNNPCKCLEIYITSDQVFQEAHVSGPRPKAWDSMSEVHCVDKYIQKIHILVQIFWTIYGGDPTWLPLIPYYKPDKNLDPYLIYHCRGAPCKTCIN